MPARSACVRKAAMGGAGRGKAGTWALSGPNSRIARFTMPRAGRPVKIFVTAVWAAAGEARAARCRALVVACGHSKYAVPT